MVVVVVVVVVVGVVVVGGVGGGVGGAGVGGAGVGVGVGGGGGVVVVVVVNRSQRSEPLLGWCLPRGQARQLSLPAGKLYLPPPHWLQRVLPRAVWYCPEGHSSHASTLYFGFGLVPSVFCANFPGGQNVHMYCLTPNGVTSSFANVPDAQLGFITVAACTADSVATAASVSKCVTALAHRTIADHKQASNWRAGTAHGRAERRRCLQQRRSKHEESKRGQCKVNAKCCARF